MRDQPRVWGEYADDPQFLLIGESPGEEENEQRRPFVGPAGRFLNSALHLADLPRHRGWVTNLISCRPPSNDLDSEEGLEALACCRPGFEAEIAAAMKTVRVIVPLGTKPLASFGFSDGITKARGSVYLWKEKPLVPTFHPSFILRGMKHEEGTWIGDFKKIKEILKSGWRAPLEHFTTHPTLAELETFTKDAIKKRALVAVDLETTGFRPESSRIVVIGLALDSNRALSVPFLSQFGRPYWKGAEENAARSLLQNLFRSCTCLFQNGLGIDLPFLEYNGLHVSKTPHDVILMHHVIHPELPHNLPYIVSVFGSTPYWKGEMLGRMDRLLDMPDETVRTYNLRDAVVLHQVFPGLKADLEEFGLWSVYNDIERELILPVLEMEMTGLFVDQKALKTWNRSIRAKKAFYEKRCFETAELPSDFSLSKDDHLRLLIYGEVAPQFTRAREELERDYGPTASKPKRRDTKKFRELEAKIRVLEETRVLYEPRSRIRRTDSGRASVKEEFLIARKISCLNRLAEIREMKRKDASEERRDIERTVSFLNALFSANEADKLCTTYSRFPIWKDGRVHSSYNIHGTATGRLSSKEPNAQNIPEEARVIFVPRPGCKFVGPDYVGLEIWVQAYDADDNVMLEMLLSGKNVHDETTRELFGVDSSNPLWKNYRMASKKYRFGHLQYGGTLHSIYEKLMLEVPDLPITFSEIARADRAYMEKHPALSSWIARQTALCDADPRIVTNAFGRRRILLGEDADVVREALNTPIQSTGADIVNTAMILIFKECKKRGLHAKFVAQVHDQLLMEVPNAELAVVKKIMKKHMERTFHLWNRDVSFPVEMKVGANWRDLE